MKNQANLQVGQNRKKQIQTQAKTNPKRRPFGLALLAVSFLIQPLRAAPGPIGVARNGPPPAPIMLEPGTIGLPSPTVPARFGFDRAEGHVEATSHGAGDATRQILD